MKKRKQNRMKHLLSDSFLGIRFSKDNDPLRKDMIKMLEMDAGLTAAFQTCLQSLNGIAPAATNIYKEDPMLGDLNHAIRNFGTIESEKKGAIYGLINKLMASQALKNTKSYPKISKHIMNKFGIVKKTENFKEPLMGHGGETTIGLGSAYVPSNTWTRRETQKQGNVRPASNLSLESSKGELVPDQVHPDALSMNQSLPIVTSIQDKMDDISTFNDKTKETTTVSVAPVVPEVTKPGLSTKDTQPEKQKPLAGTKRKAVEFAVPTTPFKRRSLAGKMSTAANSLTSKYGKHINDAPSTYSLNSSAYQNMGIGTGSKATMGGQPGMNVLPQSMTVTQPNLNNPTLRGLSKTTEKPLKRSLLKLFAMVGFNIATLTSLLVTAYALWRRRRHRNIDNRLRRRNQRPFQPWYGGGGDNGPSPPPPPRPKPPPSPSPQTPDEKTPIKKNLSPPSPPFDEKATPPSNQNDLLDNKYLTPQANRRSAVPIESPDIAIDIKDYHDPETGTTPSVIRRASFIVAQVEKDLKERKSSNLGEDEWAEIDQEIQRLSYPPGEEEPEEEKEVRAAIDNYERKYPVEQQEIVDNYLENLAYAVVRSDERKSPENKENKEEKKDEKINPYMPFETLKDYLIGLRVGNLGSVNQDELKSNFHINSLIYYLDRQYLGDLLDSPFVHELIDVHNPERTSYNLHSLTESLITILEEAERENIFENRERKREGKIAENIIKKLRKAIKVLIENITRESKEEKNIQDDMGRLRLNGASLDSWQTYQRGRRRPSGLFVPSDFKSPSLVPPSITSSSTTSNSPSSLTYSNLTGEEKKQYDFMNLILDDYGRRTRQRTETSAMARGAATNFNDSAERPSDQLFPNGTQNFTLPNLSPSTSISGSPPNLVPTSEADDLNDEQDDDAKLNSMLNNLPEVSTDQTASTTISRSGQQPNIQPVAGPRGASRPGGEGRGGFVGDEGSGKGNLGRRLLGHSSGSHGNPYKDVRADKFREGIKRIKEDSGWNRFSQTGDANNLNPRNRDELRRMYDADPGVTNMELHVAGVSQDKVLAIQNGVGGIANDNVIEPQIKGGGAITPYGVAGAVATGALAIGLGYAATPATSPTLHTTSSIARASAPATSAASAPSTESTTVSSSDTLPISETPPEGRAPTSAGNAGGRPVASTTNMGGTNTLPSAASSSGAVNPRMAPVDTAELRGQLQKQYEKTGIKPNELNEQVNTYAAFPLFRAYLQEGNADVVFQINKDADLEAINRLVWQSFNNGGWEANDEADNPLHMISITEDCYRFSGELDKDDCLGDQAQDAIEEEYNRNTHVAYDIPDQVMKDGQVITQNILPEPLEPTSSVGTDQLFHDVYLDPWIDIPESSPWKKFTAIEGTQIPDTEIENPERVTGNDWPLLGSTNAFIRTTLS